MRVKKRFSGQDEEEEDEENDPEPKMFSKSAENFRDG